MNPEPQSGVPSMLMRITAAPYASRAILALVVIAFCLRIGSFFILPIPPKEGDQGWYIAVAKILLHQREAASTPDPFTFIRKFGRPWGFPLLIAPFVALGTHYRLPLMIALSASSALAVFFTARVARQLLPALPMVAIVSAALVTVSPYEIQLSRYVITEPVLTPAFLAFLSLCIDAGRGPTLRAWLGITFLGALMMNLRLDSALLVLAPPIMVITHGFSGDTIARFAQLRPWLVTVLCIAALCIPLSIYPTLKSGRLVILADPKQLDNDNGLERWMAVTMMPEPLCWKSHHDYRDGHISAEGLPDSLFDTREQAAAAKQMLRRHPGPTAEAGGFFDSLAAQRRARLSTWTILPAYRIFALWFDFGPNKLHGRPRFEAVRSKPARFLLEGWVTAYAVLLACGFVATVVTILNLQNAAVIAAGTVLIKTVGQIVVGIWAGSPLSEVRYQTPVHPLALMLAVALAARIWASLCRLPVTLMITPKKPSKTQ